MDEEKIQKKINISELKADFYKNKEVSNNIISTQENIDNGKQKKTNNGEEENIPPTNEIINQIDDKKEGETNNSSKQEIGGENTEKQEELFTNYIPIFEKRRLSFAEKIENLKRKAKTNYVYILIIVFVGLFFSIAIIYITPQYHSFKNYKANIINIFHLKDDEKTQGENEKTKTGIISNETPINNDILVEQQEDKTISIENEMTGTSSVTSSGGTGQIQINNESVSKEDLTKQKIKNHFKNHQ